MAGANFQRDSIGWQLGKLRRHLGEWLEWASRSQEFSNNDFSLPDWIPYLLNFLAWVTLIIFSAWLGLKIYRLGRNYWLEQQTREAPIGIPLPFDRTIADLLQDAQKSYDRQDYRAACRYLYLGLLQYLHSQEILAHQVSRTDGEYRRSLAAKSPDQLPECATLINLHERFSFSEFAVAEQDFIHCKTALNQLVKQL